MKRPCFASVVVVALALGNPSHAAPPDKTSATAADRTAGALLDEAREHLDHKRFAEALPLLQEALDKDPSSYRIVGNLGIVEHELKRWADAANHLSLARDRFPADGPAAHREAIEMRLLDASAHASRLTVVLAPDTACLRVGDAPPRCGAQASLYVPPGPVSFTVEAPDHVTARRRVELEEDTETALTITLSPKAPPLAPKPQTAGRLPVWPGYLMAGIGLAGVVGASVLFVASDAADREAGRELDALRDATANPAPCASPTATAASRCASIADHLGRHDQLHLAATGVVVGGVSALVAGAVLFGLSVQGDGGDDVAITPAPLLTPQSAGLTLHGRF